MPARMGQGAVVAGIAQLALALCLLTTGNAPQAVADLFVDAPIRSRELDRREAWLIEHPGSAHVRVPLPDPTHRPRTIAYIDITSAPDAWMNRSYARYFGVGDIAIDPRLASPAILPEP